MEQKQAETVKRPTQPNNNYFHRVPFDVLKIFFSQSFSTHEQLCQLSKVCLEFRRAVLALLSPNKTICHLTKKSAAFNLPVYSMHQFFHASRVWAPDNDNMLETDWSFAAFMGDESSLIRILGEHYFEHQDNAGRTVAHFASMGGQLPLLRKLVLEHGKEKILINDKLGSSCMHYAAICIQVATLKWLVTDHGFSIHDKDEKFKTSALDCLAAEFITFPIALELAPLLCDKVAREGKNAQTDLFALNTKFCEIGKQEAPSPNNNTNINQLIFNTTLKIISGEMDYLSLLNELVAFKTVSPHNTDEMLYKFFC